MAANTNTDDAPRKLQSVLPAGNGCSYTASYCEENVWKLCQAVRVQYADEFRRCYVVFISNPKQSVPLWRQKAGKGEERLVVWDYHCIFLFQPDDRCVVYDLDSELPFPTYFHKYVTETFRTDQILRPEFYRYFRVIPAPEYYQTFSSDRRHMKQLDGSWLKPPPPYPPIITSETSFNLDKFINMENNDSEIPIGEVFRLTELVKKFYPSASQIP